jgi:hypothetical protein
LFLLAADGATLAIGLGISCAAIGQGKRHQMFIPLLLLAASCLLTQAGYAPRFDAIRAAPIGAGHATAAAGLTIVAVAALVWTRAEARCWTRDTLTAGVLIPSGTYLLLRLVCDLSGAVTHAWWGFVLLLAGGTLAVLQGWRAAADPDIDTAVAALARRQAGLAMTGVALTLVAHAADLPGAESLALEATFLLALGGSLAGTLTSLAAHTIGASAGTYRLSRLGGLVHLMPGTAAALGAGLLASSALPPGLGFASLWLLFQSILSAPRTGGLLSQLPLALAAAAFALSAALATAASVRLIGIALLGRPRTPRGSGARESESPLRTILLTLAGASLLAGVLPGPLLWLLAEAAIRTLAGIHGDGRTLLPVSAFVPGYPVLVLLALATGGVILASRWRRKEAKIAGVWADGMKLPFTLPFGEPEAQSAGAGFLPALPRIPLPRLPRFPAFRPRRKPSAIAGLWLILAGFGALLLFLAISG